MIEPPPAGPLPAAAADRRRVLAGLGVLGLGLLAGGCGEKDPLDDPALTVLPLAAVPLGGRLEIDHQGIPVELRRSAQGIEARSLLCTHMGCNVDFRADLAGYLCRCHGGRYDLDGRVVGGPPQRPLRRLPVQVVGDRVGVGP